MKNPHVYVCNGTYQLIFWTERGERKQKSTGKGKEGEAIAEKLQLALTGGVVTSEDLLSCRDLIDVVNIIEKHKQAHGFNNINSTNDSCNITARSSAVDGCTNNKLNSVGQDNGGKSKNISPNDVTLFRAICDYIKDMRTRKVTEDHIRAYELVAKNWYLKFLGTNTLVNDITYQMICDMIIEMQNKNSVRGNGKISQATINRYCVYLKSTFNYCIDQGFILANPMNRWHKTKEKPRRFRLTMEDMQLIINNSDDHVKWAIEVCYNTGVRPGTSELLSLRYDCVDFNTKTMTIYAPKTKTTRVIPIKETFLEHLREKQKTTKEGFIIEFKGHQVKSIHKAFAQAVSRAGIKYDVRLYDLRHMFCTFMLSNGADLATVSKMMGHSSVKMTADVYYQCLEKEKKRAIDLLPEFPSTFIGTDEN